LKRRPVIAAFTATATHEVQNDIVQLIELDEPFVLSTGFDRSNLYFEVKKPEAKYHALEDILDRKRGESGIIYCSTRKTVEEVCERLNADGIGATRYHAGLTEKERILNQDRFIHDKVRIMVATNAFGMGIDKSNVSFVIHYNMPMSMEGYYQEAGRAGRDGTPAECILLYAKKDVATNQFLINQHNPDTDLDSKTLEQVKEKDRERLKRMTFYCHTNDCLREYILRYFGDHAQNYCGNCSSCLANYEETDITEHAQKILSCVYRTGQRFGIGIITDVLRGSKNKKILQRRLDQSKTYGILAMESEKRIREIINY